MIAVWYHEALRVMTSGDPENSIFIRTTHMMEYFPCSHNYSKLEGKYQESIQSSTPTDPGHYMEE